MITIHCVVNKDKDTYIRDSMRISVLAYEAILFISKLWIMNDC
jgi:hypothetical protein